MVVSYIFFSRRRRHTKSKRDWSSDVCSSDLLLDGAAHRGWNRVGFDLRPVRCPSPILGAPHRPAVAGGLPEGVFRSQALQVELEQGPGQVELPTQQFTTGNRHASHCGRTPTRAAIDFGRSLCGMKILISADMEGATGV